MYDVCSLYFARNCDYHPPNMSGRCHKNHAVQQPPSCQFSRHPRDSRESLTVVCCNDVIGESQRTLTSAQLGSPSVISASLVSSFYVFATSWRSLADPRKLTLQATYMWPWLERMEWRRHIYVAAAPPGLSQKKKL